MNPLEIALIIIGIITIILSCILVDKGQKAVSIPGKAFSVENSLTSEDKQQLKDKMIELLSEVSDEVVVHTDDTLSNISNEKIMAVNEFSDQILEKINRNHEEVVFLYNMLNDKEKELKEAVREIDSSKKKVQDIIEIKANSRIETAKTGKQQSPEKSVSHPTLNVKTLSPSGMTVETPEIPALNMLNSNNNSQILALYSQGKSIMEISKLLSLGQGEVKLVIDLFKGKK
jgi:hypothetical protein